MLSQFTTIRDLQQTGRFNAANQVAGGFITWDDMVRIAPRFIVYAGPGWYSYDGSMYRAGTLATNSRIQVA